ncbi:DGQHR domain-containing protein DpdB [Gemmata sp. JC717]|uniref:DGQHR domain-containing protein DpdB n=1 Tax=Gemmata algarum TaxID=2975278 RepID=UPI0021BA43C3|nr:DGQHR domain-containing protein DpdB [Gemmata algarum]MDY3551369.1 DGQHR domain-containing protein DpdB [Gemmata algarum]
MPPAKKFVRRRALRILQDEAHPLYVFCMTGEELLSIADISRISRDTTGKLLGYQRPEVKRHVQDIVSYLNGKSVVFPNSIILALSSQVHFVRSRGPEVDDGLGAAGILEIPLPAEGTAKPAWIVDGQQRALAISKCRRKDFPIPVNAFVADEIDLQRDQFLRVNNTRPLPRGLITELLPEVSTTLPARLAAKKIPSAICDWLNQNPASPFHKLIRRSSMTDKGKEAGIVTDTSIIKVIEESLTSTSGCLFPYRNIATGETDAEGICAVLVTYWSAVKRVFPDAWGKSANQSRLMHGAGLRAMGRLMDRIMSGVNGRDPKAPAIVEKELRRVAPICRWTEGNWEELNDLAWNDIQNLPRHIRILSNLLIRHYVQSKGTA